MASLTTETTTTTSWSKELLRIDTEINTQRTLRDAADKDTSPESDIEEDRITKVIRGLKKERSNIGQQMADQMQAISALQVKFGFAVGATALATGETKDVEKDVGYTDEQKATKKNALEILNWYCKLKASGVAEKDMTPEQIKKIEPLGTLMRSGELDWLKTGDKEIVLLMLQTGGGPIGHVLKDLSDKLKKDPEIYLEAVNACIERYVSLPAEDQVQRDLDYVPDEMRKNKIFAMGLFELSTIQKKKAANKELRIRIYAIHHAIENVHQFDELKNDPEIIMQCKSYFEKNPESDWTMEKVLTDQYIE